MLVLTRKLGEQVVIDGNITVTVMEMQGNRVRLAFEAPDKVSIMRNELLQGDLDLKGKPREWNDESGSVRRRRQFDSASQICAKDF